MKYNSDQTYDAFHWVHTKMKNTDIRFIAKCQVTMYEEIFEFIAFSAKAPGYATIIALDNFNGDKASIINTPIRKGQLESLMLLTSEFSKLYIKLNLWPQIMFLGNNSHSFDEE
eukprot:UN28174